MSILTCCLGCGWDLGEEGCLPCWVADLDDSVVGCCQCQDRRTNLGDFPSTQYKFE